MEQEFLQLAREAVVALKDAPAAPPVDIAAWAQVGVTATVGVGQLILIAWGLRRMGKASEERNRQLDIIEAANREQAEAVREEGRAQAEALGKIGQALDRQGEVLAELLRRTA